MVSRKLLKCYVKKLRFMYIAFLVNCNETLAIHIKIIYDKIVNTCFIFVFFLNSIGH
jgi:hypothetical protein